MPSLLTPWAYFIGMAWLLGVAHLLSRRRPPPVANLNAPMEALRGILATGVFFCHCVVTYFYLTTGTWTSPPSRFYEFLGSASVELFFFVSGYLFWSKCIASDGITNIRAFYWARIRRVVPAFYASLLLILCLVFVTTGFVLRVPWSQFCGDMGTWLLFCIPNFLRPINGVREAPLMDAAVLWTLQLEIIFYAVLPWLYRLFKGYRVFIYLAFLWGLYWWIGHQTSFRGTNWANDPIPRTLARFFGFGFGGGMLIAFLQSRCPRAWLDILKSRRFSIIPLVSLTLPIFTRAAAHSPLEFFLLAVPFVFVVAGNDFGGLLSMRGTFLLGACSYSFYITHGIVLYALSHWLNRQYPVGTLSPVQYWGWMLAFGVVAVFLADVLYQTVELRFMKRDSILRQAGASIAQKV